MFKVNDGGAESGGIARALENKIADIICQEGYFSFYLARAFKITYNFLNSKPWAISSTKSLTMSSTGSGRHYPPSPARNKFPSSRKS